MLCGVAKDLTKLGGKTVTKLVTGEERQTRLFKLVSLITGWKNSLKGAGYFIGAWGWAAAAWLGAGLARRRGRLVAAPRGACCWCRLGTWSLAWPRSARHPCAGDPEPSCPASCGRPPARHSARSCLAAAPRAGAACLSVSYQFALGLLLGLILLAMPWAATGLTSELGRARKEDLTLARIFRQKHNINVLSLSRCALLQAGGVGRRAVLDGLGAGVAPAHSRCAAPSPPLATSAADLRRWRINGLALPPCLAASPLQVLPVWLSRPVVRGAAALLPARCAGGPGLEQAHDWPLPGAVHHRVRTGGRAPS
jgi:hypothetical protein